MEQTSAQKVVPALRNSKPLSSYIKYLYAQGIYMPF